jgi:hypothetical protein
MSQITWFDLENISTLSEAEKELFKNAREGREFERNGFHMAKGMVGVRFVAQKGAKDLKRHAPELVGKAR